MKHTPAPWIIGKRLGTIIAPDALDSDVNKYYGGLVIAESISSKANLKLIAAAPDLLDAAIKVINAFHVIDRELLELQNAITKATSEKEVVG